MKQDTPLVRRFSTLEPYQEAYTLACSLETEGQGCWLTVSRTRLRTTRQTQPVQSGPGPGRGVRTAAAVFV